MEKKSEYHNKVIDLDYLFCLSKGDTDFVKKMINLFIEENPREIEKFEESILSKDFSAIHASAHKLKSSIPFIGINKIIEREVMEIERLAAAQSDINEIERLFPKINDICRKARAELADYS